MPSSRPSSAPKVEVLPLPQTSPLWNDIAPGDFIDGYAVKSSLSPREAADLAFAMPGWATALLRLRNTLMKPFGLKTDVSREGQDAIFPVCHEDADELIIGTDDKHLNFRISIRREANRIHMATWVHRNNALGHIYLAVVKPFHVLIVRDGMRRVARAR